jgi:hypothetical protein
MSIMPINSLDTPFITGRTMLWQRLAMLKRAVPDVDAPAPGEDEHLPSLQ